MQTAPAFWIRAADRLKRRDQSSIHATTYQMVPISLSILEIIELAALIRSIAVHYMLYIFRHIPQAVRLTYSTASFCQSAANMVVNVIGCLLTQAAYGLRTALRFAFY